MVLANRPFRERRCKRITVFTGVHVKDILLYDEIGRCKYILLSLIEEKNV